MRNEMLSKKTYNKLKKEINHLKLEPSSSLSELQISKEMGVSRTTVRSALQRLVSEGWVEMKEGKKNSFYVSSLSITKFREIYQLRTALECLSIELASINLKSDDIKDLESILKKQDLLVKNNAKLEELLDIDRKFHRKIAMITANSMLIYHLEELIDLYYRYNYFALSSNNRLKQAVSEHKYILKAIESGEIEFAKNQMILHLSKTNEHISYELGNRIGYS